jgi:hypothetical protein
MPLLTAYAIVLPSMPADRSCGYHAGVGRPPPSLPLPIPAPPPNPLVGLPYHLFHPFPPLFPLHSHSTCHLRPISLFLAGMAYKTPSAGCCHAMLHGRNFPTSCEFILFHGTDFLFRRYLPLAPPPHKAGALKMSLLPLANPLLKIWYYIPPLPPPSPPFSRGERVGVRGDRMPMCCTPSAPSS